MSKYQKGFGLIIIFPLILMSMLSLSHQFEKLFYLQSSHLDWKASLNAKELGALKQEVFIKQHPCLLLCQEECLSAKLWKIEYEKAIFYVLKPLKSNLCRQKKALKMYHTLVAWRFDPKL